MKRYGNLGFILLAATALAVLSGCGGPQSSPENVVRAWIKADIANNCDTVESLTDPTARDGVEFWCGPGRWVGFNEARIDHVYVEKEVSDKATVEVIGYFATYNAMLDFDQEWDSKTFRVRRLDGKWYVRDYP